jgi:hypothetical protein
MTSITNQIRDLCYPWKENFRDSITSHPRQPVDELNRPLIRCTGSGFIDCGDRYLDQFDWNECHKALPDYMMKRTFV